MSVKSRISIVIKKATILVLTPNLQKTSVGLGNLRADDWWWWKGCQGVLYLLSNSIPGKSGIKKLRAAKSLAR